MKPYAKGVVLVAPVAATDGDTAAATVDCKGFSFANISVIAGTAANTTKHPTLKVTECDTSNGTFADITAFIGTTGTAVTTASGFCIPEACTAGGTQKWTVMFDIDLKGRKRYLALTYEIGTNQTFAAFALLSKAAELPITATKAGVNVLVQG